MTLRATGPVILASSSATRRTILENAGLRVDVAPPRIDEDDIKESMIAERASGDAIADVLAEQKACYVSRRRAGELVIGADQILLCGDTIYSKPADRSSAKEQLTTLRGRDHQLISCVCVACDGDRLWHHLDRAQLSMRNFSDAFIDDYLDAIGDTAFDGPGSYRIEGLGAQLFTFISGDYFTILGLPLIPLLDYLRVRSILES